MKKIILPAVLAAASIFLFSFSSKYFKSLEMVNDTDFDFSEMWVAKTTDSEWGDAIEIEDEDKVLHPGEKVKIDLPDDYIKEGFDVLIWDPKAKEFHEINDWTEKDLSSTWHIVQGDHSDDVKHGKKPAHH